VWAARCRHREERRTLGFFRRATAETVRREARGASFVPSAALGAAYGGAKPVVERLLYDDELRDNIRTFIASANNIFDELSGESPTEIIDKLWDNNKLRREVETAVEAAQEGAKRIRGQKVRGGGSGKRLLVLALVGGGVGFLFLNPKTGPEARRLAGEAFEALRS
jgi:hypothetical protein